MSKPAPHLIRDAIAADAEAIAGMANRLAVRTTGQAGAMTAEIVVRHLIGAEDLGLIVAELQGAVAGYALFSAAYDTAHAARGIYLSDLYVLPDRRRRGLARALMAEIACRAVAEGGGYLWWVVTPGNAEARAFYDRLGAVEDRVHARAVFEAPFDALLRPAG